MATVNIEDHMTGERAATPAGATKWGGCAILCCQGRQGRWSLWLRPRCLDGVNWPCSWRLRSWSISFYQQNHSGALCGLNMLKSSFFRSNIACLFWVITHIDVSRFRRDPQLLGTGRTITCLTSGLGESAIHCVQRVGNRLLQRGETVQKGADHFWGDFQKVSLWLQRETLCLWQFLCNLCECLLEWFCLELSKKAFSCSPKIFQDEMKPLQNGSTILEGSS